MSVTTCLTPLPSWHDDASSAAAALACAGLAAVLAAAIEVPARPSVPSSAAEPATAVTRNHVVWRPARPRASRPLLMSMSSHASGHGVPKSAPRELTIARSSRLQKRPGGVILCKSGETFGPRLGEISERRRSVRVAVERYRTGRVACAGDGL